MIEVNTSTQKSHLYHIKRVKDRKTIEILKVLEVERQEEITEGKTLRLSLVADLKDKKRIKGPQADLRT